MLGALRASQQFERRVESNLANLENMASGSKQHWTITQAVERTNASNSTIRRYRDQDKFPNAYKDPEGVWKYPVEDLLAAGFKLKSSEQPEQPVLEHAEHSKEQVSKLPEQVPLEQVQLTIREKDLRILELELKLKAAEDKIQYLTKENERSEQRLRDEKESVRDQLATLRQAMAMIEPSKKTEQREHLDHEQGEHTKEQPSKPAQISMTTPHEQSGEQPKKRWWRR